MNRVFSDESEDSVVDGLIQIRNERMQSIPAHIREKLIGLSDQIRKRVFEWWTRTTPLNEFYRGEGASSFLVQIYVTWIQELCDSVKEEFIGEVIPFPEEITPKLREELDAFFLFETSILLQHHLDDSAREREFLKAGPFDQQTGAVRFHHYLN